jgi:hypothetical protein
MAMGLLYMLALWSNVCVIRGFGSISFVTTMQPFSMVIFTIGRTSLVSVGHPKSGSVMSLMLRTVCYAMARALALYYRYNALPDWQIN